MDSIDKLKEKVENDPASTLFVPLAEEYRKIGQLDDAIMVLKSGIDRQPGYMSARVSLGKIYLEKKMKTEAVIEFEKVVEAIPDNLFAHRKLADLYKELGETETAISRYETVLSLNPLDEEAQEILQGLKAGGPEATMEEQPEESAAIDQEDIAPGETFTEHGQEEEPLVGMDEPPDWSSALDEASAEEEGEESVAVTEDEEKVGDVESVLEALSEPEGPEAVSVETVEESGSHVETEVSGTEQAVKVEPEGDAGFKEADQNIENGDYEKAMKIYNSHLRENPDDAQVLQRVDELRALLKLLGRENELIESELNYFLEEVKARRDEFYGSS
jgi:tetratricopeptide (TPR) repeat protein